MEKDIANKVDGLLGRIFSSIVSGGRAQNAGYDNKLAEKEAQELYDVILRNFIHVQNEF